MTSDQKDWPENLNAPEPDGDQQPPELDDSDWTPPNSDTETPIGYDEPPGGTAAFDRDAGIPFEPGGYVPEEPEPVTPSWERRAEIGFASALFKTIGEVLFHPAKAFRHVPVKGDIVGPLLFVVLLGTVGGIFQAFYGIMGLGLEMIVPSLGEMTGADAGTDAMLTIIMMILSPLIVAITTFIGAGILHLFLMLFGGANRGFEATFKVVAYVGGAVSVFELIPFCGSWILFVWGTVCEVIGAREAQETDTWRALLAVLVP
ncbi:MAG: YIP1 family protein, partial [bacterium]